MAIVSSNKRQQVDGASQDLITKSYTEVYLVQVDVATQDPVSIRDANAASPDPIPDFGDEFPSDSKAHVATKGVSAVSGSRLLFEVTVEYSTGSPTSFTTTDDLGDPLQEPTQINWDIIETERVVTIDINKAAIENSAEDPFDPTITETDHRLQVTIVRNEETYNAQAASDFMDTTNVAEVSIAGLVAAIGVAKCVQFTAQSAETNGVQYHIVTYRFIFASPGDLDELGQPILWKRILLDIGLNKIVGGEKVPITSAAGPRITKPVKLDGAGLPLAVGAPPKYKRFVTLRTSVFADLNLPAEGLPEIPE